MSERLYPDYKPRGIQSKWDHCSMRPDSAAGVLKKYGIPDNWGSPVDVVAWFSDTTDSLRVLVAIFTNRKRVTLRLDERGGYQILTEPLPPPPEAAP